MKQRVSDLIAAEASRSFVGRQCEMALLQEGLDSKLPAIVFLHGIAGIGKSTLLAAFLEHARSAGARVLALDCRSVEPTERGFLRALSSVLRRKVSSVRKAVSILASRNRRVLLVLDHYELCRLLDSWLRQAFIPQLPSTVLLLLSSREPPGSAWSTSPGWHNLLHTVELDGLSSDEAKLLLSRSKIPGARAAAINRVVRGHPLALTLAASTLGQQSGRNLETSAIQRVIEELAKLYLADISDAPTRQALEASCVLRRVTIPLLSAMLREVAAGRAFESLRELPFVHSEADGLHVHDSVKQAVAASLRSADPIKYHAYRRSAWSELRSQLACVPVNEHWRYTADMLFLLDNPVIREAFFPSESSLFSVEPSRAEDRSAIESISARHEGSEACAQLSRWFAALPQSFSSVRDATGKVVGFYCLFDPNAAPRNLLRRDPVANAWIKHLRQDSPPKAGRVLFLRRWLADASGEAPSAIQAACWLDIKRTYLALRPQLRRVYLALSDLAPYASVAQKLGFCPIESAACKLDQRTYYTAMLDFGPASVDGWLSRLVAAELDLGGEQNVVDLEGRQLVLSGKSVPLTRLEFAVMQYLHERKGKPVARSALIQDVWGHKYDVGSNVVDVVIKSLRKKLGKYADAIETVTGYGYKLRYGN